MLLVEYESVDIIFFLSTTLSCYLHQKE